MSNQFKSGVYMVVAILMLLASVVAFVFGDVDLAVIGFIGATANLAMSECASLRDRVARLEGWR